METRYWVVRLHAAAGFSWGVWLVPPTMTVPWMVVVGVGLFLENCIVDASIL